MGFPWCKQAQDLALLSKRHMLKLPSLHHWKAAMILPTYEPNLVCFAHFPLNPTRSPAHLLFVISLEGFVRDRLAACL